MYQRVTVRYGIMKRRRAKKRGRVVGRVMVKRGRRRVKKIKIRKSVRKRSMT